MKCSRTTVLLGSGCDDANSDSHGVLWTNGMPVDLGTLGGPQTGAAGLNNLGEVVGWSQTSTYADDGFLWSDGKMTDLGLNFFAAAINDNGVIVGGNEIYSNGTLQDLNNLIPVGTPYQIASMQPRSTTTARSSPRPTTPRCIRCTHSYSTRTDENAARRAVGPRGTACHVE